MALEATTADKPDAKPATDAAPADKAPAPEAKVTDKAATPAPTTDDKASAADGKAEPSTDDQDDGGATEDRQAGDAGGDWLDDDTTQVAAAEDGKEAADKGAKKPKGDASWRDDVLSSAEQRWLKKANFDKLDDEKKAVAKKELSTKAEALKRQLARYGTEEAAILAGMEAQEKLRAGAKTEKPAADASPEAKAKWREEQGLPVEPADIAIPRVEMTAPDGSRISHKWTDADKPLHDSYRDMAFDLGLSQEQVNRQVAWQVEQVQIAAKQQRDMIAHIDKEDRKEMMGDLRDEFGEETRPRMELVQRLLKDRDVFPEGVEAMLWNARTPDGRRLVNQAAITKFFSEAAVAKYGDNFLITGDKRIALEDEESKIRTVMKNDYDKYLKEGLDKKLAVIMEKKEGKRGRAA